MASNVSFISGNVDRGMTCNFSTMDHVHIYSQMVKPIWQAFYKKYLETYISNITWAMLGPWFLVLVRISQGLGVWFVSPHLKNAVLVLGATRNIQGACTFQVVSISLKMKKVTKICEHVFVVLDLSSITNTKCTSFITYFKCVFWNVEA